MRKKDVKYVKIESTRDKRTLKGHLSRLLKEHKKHVKRNLKNVSGEYVISIGLEGSDFIENKVTILSEFYYYEKIKNRVSFKDLDTHKIFRNI